MKAFENNADILKYSLKLNKLDDDNLFLIASSYEVETYGKKVYTIKSIINKIKHFSKEDFLEFDKQIDEILKKKDEKEIEKKKNVAPKILISDRIFFIFAPNVNVNNAKLFYFLPINVAITIYFMASLALFFDFSFDFNFFSYSRFFEDFILINFTCTAFLFISMTDENSPFAKLSLFMSEIIFLFILFKSNFKENEKKILMCFESSLMIYLSYIQLIVANNKENKKLNE